jgi:hypothetical protein
MNATPESVWALLQEVGRKQEETARQMKETDKKFQETDRQIQETSAQMRETDRQIQETSAQMKESERLMNERSDKLDKKLEKLGEQIGGVHQSLGALVETLMAGRLSEKFPQYKFTRSFQRIKIFDKNNNPVTEIDILLSDDEWAMAVEVKREPRLDGVDHHLRRLELMRKYDLKEISGKKLLGAIAGGVVPLEVREYAQKNGFYVLELNGEQVSLLDSPEGFVPIQR